MALPLPRIVILLLCLAVVAPVMAQPSQAPLADPVLDADAVLRARRATHWDGGGARMVLLEENVELSLGTYGWRADRAVVRIEREYALGRTVHHLAMYLDNARALRGKGATTADAKRLLVTGSTRGEIDLVTDLLESANLGGDPFVAEAQARYAGFNQTTIAARTLAVPQGDLLNVPRTKRPRIVRSEVGDPLLTPEERAAAGMDDPQLPPTGADGAPTATPTQRDLLGPTTTTTAQGRSAPFGQPGSIVPSRGIVSFRADRIVIRNEGEEKVVVLIGHVRVVYQNDMSDSGMSLSAENAVIFLADKTSSRAATRQLRGGDVKGVYLEQNVIATNGDYTVRSPRVFYDLRSDRAVVLDAVMYTWDVERQIPLYVRADKMMQESRDTWSAEQATLTTSEFAEPHFAIGARSVTVNYQENRDGNPTPYVTAHGATARVGKMPVFYWPKVRGKVQETPIRRVDMAYSNEDGFILRTQWDVFHALGREAPDGVDARANLDFLGNHGPGFGLDVEYDRGETFGEFKSYLLAWDDGEDDIADRDEVGHDGEQRGFARLQHRTPFGDDWELSLELGYVSDETFLDQFFQDEANIEKPYETSVYLKKQREDWAFTFLARYDVNDFVANNAVLQSPGYNVDKLPELGYYRIGTSLWDDRLTYYTENRISYMRARPGEDDPADRGFNAAQSAALFGIAPNTTDFDTAFDAAGLEDGYIARFDSRHELQMPTSWSIFQIVPYAALRFTSWSDDTNEMHDEDNYRIWGAVGTRISTTFERSYDQVSSELLDLHRLRHIIEPNVDVFAMGTSIDREHLYVFDSEVEGINEGWGVKLGLRNTLQTQRGGPGRWRSVDWLVLDTDVILRGDEAFHDSDSDIPRYYSYRPEYGIGGDHFNTRLMWMITDTLASVTQLTYDFDAGETAQWMTGLRLQHSPQLAVHMSYTDTPILGSRQLNYGFDYQLTTKYTVSYNHGVNLAETTDQYFDVQLIRQLPRWKFIVMAQFDDLDDDSILGIALVPDGFSGRQFARNLALFNPPN